jgi:predicted RNase H-like HicB family nuclease
MRRNYRVTAIIEREGDGYVSLCPKLDIASQGDTVEEARRNLQEALVLFLETADASEIAERSVRSSANLACREACSRRPVSDAPVPTRV